MHPTLQTTTPRRSTLALAAIVVLGATLSPGLSAQDEAPEEAKKAAAEAGAVETFSKALADLEELKATFEELGKQFQEASPEEQVEIRNRAMQLQNKGNEILGSIADAFGPAYTAAPENEEVKEWIPNVLAVLFQLNRYEDIATLGQKLMTDGHTDGNIQQLTGTALYAMHRFGESEKLLEKADEAGALDQQGQRVLADAKAYQEFWTSEQEIRKKEAADDDLPRVVLTTTRGPIEIELFENEAPGAVGNFVSLVEKKFYDGITFHRVIPGFMAQGGDPNTKDEIPFNDGQGGPGYTIACECYEDDARLHFSGSLSMAHAGKDTGGSQFFLTHLPTGHLNGKHTVFGRITKGLDVARSLQMGDKIVSAEVVRKRDHEYAPPADAKKKDTGADGTNGEQ